MVELFSYQIEGLNWLSSKRVALLADEMGLGKSAQVIVAGDRLGCKRVLVVCPSVAKLNWVRQYAKFSSLNRSFFLVNTAKDKIPFSQSVIVSYSLLSTICISDFGQFDLIIVDEVHYAKGVSSKRTHAIFGKKGIIHVQNTTCKIWCLSGTPAPNNASELWPLLYSFGAISQSYDHFVQRFCVSTVNHFRNQVQITGTNPARIPELRGILAKVMLRRTKDEVGHMLPKILYSDLIIEEGVVDLDILQSFVQYVFPTNRISELEAKLKEELTQVKKAVSSKDINQLIGLAKSVSTLRRYVGCQKVEKIAELVTQELKNKLYDKIVLFCIHKDVVEGLRIRLRKFGAVTLYSGTRFDSANTNIDKFQNNPSTKVFIGNITACGIAIDLTAAHNVLMVEQEWTPSANAQAIARCHRHGQTKTVTVRVVGLANSLDEKIARLLRKKTSELTSIFDKPTNLGPTSAVQTFEDLMI